MAAFALATAADEPPPVPEITPPRLSFIDGKAGAQRKGEEARERHALPGRPANVRR